MKYTNEELLNRIKNIDNGEYECLTDIFPEGIKTEVTLKHNCGNIYKCKLKGFLNEGKSRCQNCKNIIHKSTKKVTEKEFIERLKKETKNEYSYISGFKNTKDKCLLKHNICNKNFNVSPNMFLNSKKSRCPYCSNKNRGKYAIKENYLENLLNQSIDGIEYKWLENYKNNNKIKHRILHKNCNKEYLVRPNDFQQGYRCPYCRQSKGETKISYILKEKQIPFKEQYIFNDCIYKQPLKFDFKIESNTGKIILIEYDGEFHERNPYSQKILQEQKIRDKIKNEYCKNKNIDLYRISYKKYNDLENIIKDILEKYSF
jgi:hypothetical protein